MFLVQLLLLLSLLAMKYELNMFLFITIKLVFYTFNSLIGFHFVHLI